MVKGLIVFQGTRGGSDSHEVKMTVIGDGITFPKLAAFQNALKQYLSCIVRKVSVSEIFELASGSPSVDANVDRAAIVQYTALQDGATHKYRIPAPKAGMITASDSGDRVKTADLAEIGALFGAAMSEDMRAIDGWVTQRK